MLLGITVNLQLLLPIMVTVAAAAARLIVSTVSKLALERGLSSAQAVRWAHLIQVSWILAIPAR